MNILFFLTPKEDVIFVEEEDTLRQVIEKIDHHRYTAIPMLNRQGKYTGTISEGDLLRYIKNVYTLNIRDAEYCPIKNVPLRWTYTPVRVNCNMEDLVEVAMGQNFVPVVDEQNNFIGIIRRQDILKYCYNKSK